METHPGARLRELREELGVSQRHVADLSGVSQSEVSKIERGSDVCWSTLRRLFGALGRDIDLAVLPDECEDDTLDYLEHGIQERKDRMEAGRDARWCGACAARPVVGSIL
jgi:transcriptional regulator with XRE-family HTH domain